MSDRILYGNKITKKGKRVDPAKVKIKSIDARQKK